ncbi:phosphatase PAP2 family protein [Peribacillus butanolivorans]|uniref:phosphatase PAP2 family protein n=1 Tax=Peribacillus butanolivorans TaxID=421767 RepID=UPI0022A9CF40|nr:phosphatase PAP2 family protein [Peribacillus butanolivorans]
MDRLQLYKRSCHQCDCFVWFSGFLNMAVLIKKISRTMLIFISAIFILTIGFSRIYLGAHYPSDILGGFFTGGFWLGSTIWIYQRYKMSLAPNAS